jgi:hypothetical protein
MISTSLAIRRYQLSYLFDSLTESSLFNSILEPKHFEILTAGWR